ncbi:MAG: DNA (cytosine-5-)-methyltransferase [Chitinophagaceae bacterium]|nr:MAG: DNA (cytosine-5-)-methyltransferase [Chitinophagaceae bacterium]
MLRHGSLFTGIGGFDLAATWMGWENVFMCEKDSFCNKILKAYWPQTDKYEDIRAFKAVKYRGLVDIISGGFPCQPFSQAGKRKGKEDDRYLWPEARRIITEVRPKWIVLENVAGLFSILEPTGFSEMEAKAVELFCQDETYPTNETIVRLQRRIIGTIVQEISSAGYVLPQLADGTPILLCIPACAVNAPHRRDRVWFIAHSKYDADRSFEDTCEWAASYGEATTGRETSAEVNKGRFDRECDHKGDYPPWKKCNRKPGAASSNEQKGRKPGRDYSNADHCIATDTSCQGLEGTTSKGESGAARRPSWYDQIPGWDEWPAQSPVLGGNDGIPGQLDGISFSQWRTESIKAFGNAIVPQVALEIFKVIDKIERIW